MYNVSDDFITQIGIAGKEKDTKIIIENEELIPQSFKHSFSGNIFTSIMQKIEFEIKDRSVLLENTIVKPKHGLKVNGEYEYIEYSNYNVYSSEINYDTNITKTVAYDNLIKFMIKYEVEKLNITFPTTILGLIQSICNYIGIQLYSTDFFNANLSIEDDLFTVLNCTYRDVIDYICQATLTTAIIKDNKLYFKNVTDTNKIITPQVLKKFKIKQKFGGCNSLVLGRGDLNDNIYSKDDTLIEIDNLQEIRFDNNEILDKRREQVIDNMFNQIKGLKYYSFETKDLGIGIFEPVDFCYIQDLDENTYKVLILNQNIIITSGCEGFMSAEVPSASTTKYQYATDSQKRQTKTEIIVDKQKNEITQLTQETTENSEKLSKVEQDIEGVTTTIKDSTKDLKEKINIIEQTIDGTKQTLTDKGGNNVFYYAKEFWNNGTEKGIANLEEYTDTEIQQKSVSGNGYIINNGTSEQKQVVKNDNYTISFTYKKLISLATGTIEINGTKYNLTSTDLKEEIITQKIDTNIIDIKIISDTNKAFKVFDLMVSIGNEKQIWTQNPNETRTDTVTIGKGIEVNSSSKNTFARFDADGNRVFNKTTGEVVTELTDKGVDTDKVIADEAQIGGILIQKINNQTWISSLI